MTTPGFASSDIITDDDTFTFTHEMIDKYIARQILKNKSIRIRLRDKIFGINVS